MQAAATRACSFSSSIFWQCGAASPQRNTCSASCPNLAATPKRWACPPAATAAEVGKALLQLPEDRLRDVLTTRDYSDLMNGYRERVTDTHNPHIASLPQALPGLFANAAERARRAGFDGVELHYAHAYTMASFLSATNTRTDGYGGNTHARLRLPLEVYAAVRARVGADFVVGARFLSDECLPDGSAVDDACRFAPAFAAAGMDFLSLSRGGKFDDAKQPRVGSAVYPYTRAQRLRVYAAVSL